MFNNMKIGKNMLAGFAFVNWERRTGDTPVPDEITTVSLLLLDNLMTTEAQAIVSAGETGSFMA